MQTRQSALYNWLRLKLETPEFSLTPLAGDASFRHYYRIELSGIRYILMDAPPDKEQITSFIDIDKKLKSVSVHVPTLYAIDEQQGFILLEDFGDELFFNHLNPKTADTLYPLALNTLSQIQTCPAQSLPCFNKSHMLQEMDLFREWFLKVYLQLELSPNENALLTQIFTFLAECISEQPHTFIHRDYHSRNLMILEDMTLGVIDFQDAMHGPFTYDLVSLLKDCYIQWPGEKISVWLNYFYNQLEDNHHWSLAEFTHGFDMCGLQRHIKVLGIFCRLNFRDQKAQYLAHIPLIISYLMSCLEKHPELQLFYEWMQTKICSRLALCEPQ